MTVQSLGCETIRFKKGRLTGGGLALLLLSLDPQSGGASRECRLAGYDGSYYYETLFFLFLLCNYNLEMNL